MVIIMGAHRGATRTKLSRGDDAVPGADGRFAAAQSRTSKGFGSVN